MEPVSVDEVMVYVSFALDRRGDSGRAGRVGLRFGDDVRDDTIRAHTDPYYQNAASPNHLDLRFQQREDGGILINGSSVRQRRDLPLFEQPPPPRAAWSEASPRL